MGAKHINCSICGERIWVCHTSWRKYRLRLPVATKYELEKIYICRACRRKHRLERIANEKRVNDSRFAEYDPVKKLQDDVQIEWDILLFKCGN